MKNSFWIWHYGDYEIFHMMNVHMRREERGMHRPAFWKISTPYASVKFRKEILCDNGYMICHIHGAGVVCVDDARYPANIRIPLSAGSHIIEVMVSNYGGLPSIFVESDVCPSDGSWESNYFAGAFQPVGYHSFYDAVQKNPEDFPFHYEAVFPVSRKTLDHGILYDFGRELFGYLNIHGCHAESILDVYYGESEEEATDTDFSYLTDHVSGNTSYRLRQRAFRYIYLVSDDEQLTVTADHEYLPLTQIGTFHCDHPLFNTIYDASVRTFHLNCREGFLDGIKRDRWVWSGDAYQSARINRYLFADREIEQRTLLGLLGKEPFEQHINTILDYSLLWFISLYEHFMTYGDWDFLRRIFPQAQNLLHFCETRLNQDGFIEGQSNDWTFIDWSDIEKVGAVCAEQMLLIHVYTVMAFLSNQLNPDTGAEYLEKGERLKQRVNIFFWDEEKGAFLDSYTSGNRHVTRHANIFAVMYDIATESQKQNILNHVLKNDSVTKITTPYFEGYELDALAKLGEFSAIEGMIQSYWGGMIHLGATTVWEEYHPDMYGTEHYAMYGGKYEKSLCHAWGAGPIYLWGRYYLGVSATAPGYETFSVEPNPGGFRQFCGTVPVNGGTVTVEYDSHRLIVTATKSGGTLIHNGKTYPLLPNMTVQIAI